MRYLLFCLALLLAGCASNPQGIGKDSDTPEKVVKLGVIESVTPIKLDDSSSGGAFAGSVVGQAGGVSVGGGRGASVGIVLGNVLGITLGQEADIATKPGLEIWVRLDGEDESAYVMQAGKPDAFKVGERVRVVYDKGEAHVEALEAGAPAKPPAPVNPPDEEQ